ncbi:MAG: sigma-70 family RNA polymerase sigma factor [Nannocystis sp.]|nr:sigma-70 family RNA polymerase sigma factor [Nannocystis sp.]
MTQQEELEDAVDSAVRGIVAVEAGEGEEAVAREGEPSGAAEERGLMAAWRSGDRRAGDVLIVRYYPTLRRFFINKAPRDAVDDLVQITFEQLLRASSRYEGRASVRTFVLAIAYRMLARHYRTFGRKQGRLDPLVDTVERVSTGMFTKLAQRLEHELLFEALRRLSIEDQAVIELVYWEHATMKEGAKILRVPEPTFKSKLRRAKERLEAELAKGRGSTSEQRGGLETLERLRAEVGV